ncbi:MAG: AI-2E family transporter [Pseudomonadota bacterium]
MALSPGEQVRWWSIGMVALLAFLWVIGEALLPYVLGAAIAYLLDPVAKRLVARGLSRVMATITITVVMLMAVVGILLLLVPAVAGQIQLLVDALPDAVRRAQAFFAQHVPGALLEEGGALRSALTTAADSLRHSLLSMVEALVSSSLALIDFLVLLVVAPVVAFYLLLDWDRLIAQIDAWLPRDHAPAIRQIAREMDQVLAGFVRGQLTVCAILGSFYAVALVLIGLQFGLLIGLFAGLISFIPFIGAILGGAISLSVALFQFWGEWQWVLAVFGVFALGQIVEGNYLTPKLVGGSVGLHPVWLMFALSAFGALFGFTGLLIAVPAAAAIGVLGRFLIRQYQGGRLYKGRGPQVEETG